MDLATFFGTAEQWFEPCDIVDGPAIARRLLQPDDAVTRHIAESLSDDELAALAAAGELAGALCAVLNRAAADVALWEASAGKRRSARSVELVSAFTLSDRCALLRSNVLAPAFGEALSPPMRVRRGDPGVATEWMPLGQIEVRSGRMVVVDAHAGSVDDSPVVDLPCGLYAVDVRGLAYGRDRRVATLRARLLGRDGQLGAEVGEAWADVALCCLADAVAFEAWSAACWSSDDSDSFTDLVHACEPAGLLVMVPPGGLSMAVVTSGFGDGSFRVSELTDDRERIGLEVELIPLELPYPWDD